MTILTMIQSVRCVNSKPIKGGLFLAQFAQLSKGTASLRQQLMSKRPEELRRNREFWKTRVEEKQRFHTKKEAWDFFGRLPSFKPKKQKEFEEEFRRKVMTGCRNGSPEEREKKLGWVDGRVAKEKRWRKTVDRKPGNERRWEKKTSSRRRTEWERILSLSPFMIAAS